MSFGKMMANVMIQRWNKLVGRMLVVDETDTHYHFVHPTKGKRRISKQRLELTL